ncbi:hypothetical protein GLOTRDRAFT_139933 [Gloeophyllum trabeum ATCC 11539]|uniref:Uncharacterized protein n=1 Tax=Gloeophyllum trabeum (strain ATCC 11539 / FP-39264 / Madison 617) TaxID=670483 RepID=S7Q0A4_GLOTA|nr:uncharacterized protein GLOTRDRAFT_139933 [Gloeophyllum trabeum ATCC 11539]EPQ52952.1 hypothetical protein GLOTRDRAFT_139933 [Gloeophyllum trabeum ATCC 11539]
MTSTTARHILRAVPSENWDEDFEFQPIAEPDEPGDTQAHPSSSTPARPPPALAPPSLQDWAEPGPSTPVRRRAQPPQTENWDDDFEDGDSPARRSGSHSHRKRTHTHNHNSVGSARRRAGAAAVENWDDDFELGKADSPAGTRRHEQGYASSDSDSDRGELGFGEKEEDKTITARSRRGLAAHATPPPPVPPIPPLFALPSDPAPFPRSPTASVFSVPTSRERDSASIAYGSTAQLNLRPTLSGSSAPHVARGFAGLPPSPPIHRERRRLRKKSRPRPIDGNVIELVDLDPDEDPPPLPLHVPPAPEDPPAPPATSEPSSPQQTKAGLPLLSRIGSVSKRWGRRKRASAGPEEVLMAEREQRSAHVPSDNDATPVAPTHRASRWFFRGGGEGDGGGGGEESDVSGEESPTKRKGQRRKSENGLGMGMGARSPPGSPLKQRAPLFPRHVSYSGGAVEKTSSRGSGSASVSMEDLALQSQSSRDGVAKVGKGKEREGAPFMSRMRRISLGSAPGLKVKHRKTKSSVGPEDANGNPPAPPTLPPLPSPSPFASTTDLSFDATTHPPVDTHPKPASTLLPPIELRPPSPTRSPPTQIRASQSEPVHSSSAPPSTPLDSLLRPSTASSTLATPNKLSTSPQSASLGRTAQPPMVASSSPGSANSGTIVPRRNSLGDLKIPARISQAQVGLRRDLELVRDFAASVDKLKQLQTTYVELVREVQQVLSASRPSSPPAPVPASSPSTTTLFGIARPKGRARSNTNPPPPPPEPPSQLASDYHAIEAKYKIVWECAELLIELGGGAPAGTGPTTSVSAPAMQATQSAPPLEGRRSRERAITLAGDEPKPDLASLPTGPPVASPPNPAWRASTGRHDLSSRQLVLLREMLHNNPESSPSSSFLGAQASDIPEETVINRGWKWGDAMGSTITLPSEESGAAHASPMKKRRTSKMGMSGLRDMLRLLKKSTMEQQGQTASASATESSLDVRPEARSVRSQAPTQRRRAKTSTGPESMKSMREHPNSPYGTMDSLNHKASPRRPSLASIFRLGQKHKAQGPANPSTDDVAAGGGSGHSRSTTEEDEDWDEIDSASDLDLAARALGVSPDGMATVKGRGKKNRSPYGLPVEPNPGARSSTPGSGPSASQSSIWADPRRLSNVEENGDGDQRQSRPESKSKRRRSSIFPSPSPKRPPSRGWKAGKSGSVRSAPPQSIGSDSPVADPKLAMTPQNIKPLLENAREVETRLNDCIEELRALLISKPPGDIGP